MLHQMGVLLVLAAIGAGGDPALDGLSANPKMRCGADSLYLAIKHLGHDTEYKPLLKRCNIGADGMSLKQVAEIADEHGLSHLTIRLRAAALCEVLRTSPISMMAICHENGGHFVLAYPTSNGRIAVIDSSTKRVDEDADLNRFSKFSGDCLLLSDSNIQLSSVQQWANRGIDWTGAGGLSILAAGSVSFLLGIIFGKRQRSSSLPDSSNPQVKERKVPTPTLALVLLVVWSANGCGFVSDKLEIKADAPKVVLLGTTTVIDVGTLFFQAKGEKPTLSFDLKNSSGVPIAIKSVRSSCGCSNAWMDVQTVKSNAQCKVHLRMNAGLAGQRRIVVSISHGGDQYTSLQIDGRFFDDCRVEPLRLHFPRATTDFGSRSSVAYLHVTSPSETAPKVSSDLKQKDVIELGPFSHRSTQTIEGEDKVFRHVFKVPVQLSNAVLTAPSATGAIAVSFKIEGISEPRSFSVTWACESGRIVVAPRSANLSASVPEQRVVVRTSDGKAIRLSNVRLSTSNTPVTVIAETAEELLPSHIVRLVLHPVKAPSADVATSTELLIRAEGSNTKDVAVPVSWKG